MKLICGFTRGNSGKPRLNSVMFWITSGCKEKMFSLSVFSLKSRLNRTLTFFFIHTSFHPIYYDLLTFLDRWALRVYANLWRTSPVGLWAWKKTCLPVRTQGWHTKGSAPRLQQSGRGWCAPPARAWLHCQFPPPTSKCQPLQMTNM